jgi:hypothetical protein
MGAAAGALETSGSWGEKAQGALEATAAPPSCSEGPLQEPKQVDGVEFVAIQEVVEQDIGPQLVEPPTIATALSMVGTVRQVLVAPGLDEKVAGRALFRLQLHAPHGLAVGIDYDITDRLLQVMGEMAL